MRNVVKLPEKKELSGEPEKDKSKARSKKPTNAVSTPCSSMFCRYFWIFLGCAVKPAVTLSLGGLLSFLLEPQDGAQQSLFLLEYQH